MGRFSIKIHLLGRQFPVTAEEQEVKAVQQAADLVAERLGSLRKTYIRQDDLDIALMCCLQLASDLVAAQQEATDQAHGNRKAAADLNSRLSALVSSLKS